MNNRINNFIQYLIKDRQQLRISIFGSLVYTPLMKHLSDKTYLSLAYKVFIGKKMNWKSPKGFNEKLQWLKIYDRNPKYRELVDKFLVRDYIKKTIGEDYLIPIIGLWDNFEDIDFGVLPNRFVLKCTHDSGSAVICKDKNTFDRVAAGDKLSKCLNRDMFYWGREWPYKGLSPKIICEQYMEDGSGDLEDYKFMCFNGEPKMVFTCTERRSEDGLKVTFFDMNWNKLPFYRHYPASTKLVAKPSCFDEMVRLAKILSKDIPFARIDFYEIQGKVYFGEITFYPGCGFEEFHPEEWDEKIGNMINLPLA